MTATKPHVCQDCNSVIEVGQKYWSYPYKALCVDCFGKTRNNEAQLSSQSYKQEACFVCGEPSVGFLYGKIVCSEHIGNAYYSVSQNVDPVDEQKNKKEVDGDV